MHGTRERLLELVIERREARVETLAASLGITPAAVRRHLDNLRADGLLDVRAVHQATGRPYHAYHATEKATGVLPSAYADLMERMLQSIDTRTDGGEEVTKSVATSLANRHRAEMTASTGEDLSVRVIQVTQSLRQEGILDDWHQGADGYHLMNGQCPYLRAAEMSNLPCESDRRAIELLMGSDVEQIHRIVDGAPTCEYVVRRTQPSGESTPMNKGAS